jgi:hypothetical protein
MRRKLINYEVFQEINKNSLTRAESELLKAEGVLAKALGEDGLKLNCFDASSVTYESVDGAYIYAGYRFDGKHIIFENIEQLIVDDVSAKEKSRTVLSKMFDEMLNNDELKAAKYFKEYISMPTVRRQLSEGVKIDIEKTGNAKKSPLAGKHQNPSDVAKRIKSKLETLKSESPSKKKEFKGLRDKVAASKGKGTRVHLRLKNDKKLKEWYNIAENVLNYVDYQEYGPSINLTSVKKDNKGNVVALRIPNSDLRNEGKILSFNWKTLTADNVVLRAKMKNLAEDVNFCRAMADLRKYNALSDDARLQHVLEAIAVRWPNIIYLTQTELAESISRALQTIGDKQADDDACNFMAEGILRTAAHAYSERVDKIVKLSGMKVEATDDPYLDFQNVASQFYKFIDENMHLEMQVYVDLYNTLVEVHKVASRENNVPVLSEINGYLKELRSVLEQESEPTLELAADVAGWLANLVETNLETGPWDVSNTPYITVNGEHPNMAKLAAKPYDPKDDFSGDWGDPLPVSDGKSYKDGKGAKEMRDDAWGNWSNDDTWPAITNPYTPKAGVFTMKGEKGADVSGDSDWSRWQSGDTWPALQNPNVPTGVTPYNHKANSDNLVVDK